MKKNNNKRSDARYELMNDIASRKGLWNPKSKMSSYMADYISSKINEYYEWVRSLSHNQMI